MKWEEDGDKEANIIVEQKGKIKRKEKVPVEVFSLLLTDLKLVYTA